jgi:hypothetical protein
MDGIKNEITSIRNAITIKMTQTGQAKEIKNLLHSLTLGGYQHFKY